MIMKVAYFIGSLNRGGTETLVLDTFRCKEKAPYESILVYRNEGDLSDAYRATGVPMFRVKPTGLKLGYIPKLRRLLRDEGVDILHTQTCLNAFLGIFCTCLSRVKLVASFHGLYSSFLGRLFAQLVIWKAEASVFVSKYVCDWYTKRAFFVSQKRCHVVYNGIDFTKFDEVYDAPDFLKENEFGNPAMVNMAMVGSFGYGRDQIFLCHVLKALKESGICNFRFYFIGRQWDNTPELYDNCVRYCKENGLLNTSVFIVGGRSDVPAILQHIDAFVYATKTDTFGIAVVEAVASGLPVIVNDWVVMREITNDGELATLYKSRDVNDCVAKIVDFITHVENRKLKAVELSSVVRQRYNIDRHIQNLNKVYETVILGQ